MSEKVQLKGGICEVNLGYNDKMARYAKTSLDIPKLSEIAPPEKEQWKISASHLE